MHKDWHKKNCNLSNENDIYNLVVVVRTLRNSRSPSLPPVISQVFKFLNASMFTYKYTKFVYIIIGIRVITQLSLPVGSLTVLTNQPTQPTAHTHGVITDKQMLQRTITVPYGPPFLSTVTRTENFLCFKQTSKL